MPPGVSAKRLPNESHEPILGELSGAERVDQDRYRVGDPDGIRQLNLDAIGQSRSDQVLRDVPRHVAGGAIDLRRVLAGKRPAAVVPHAAVGVDDDLSAGQPRVSLGPSGDETTRRVDPDLGVLVEQPSRNRRRDDGVAHRGFDLRVRDVRRVLRRNDDRVDPHRSPVVVLDRHLRFPVGTEERNGAVLAAGRELSRQAVRQHDRHGHQLVRLAARVAEHHALVAGAARVHAERDVVRLLVDRREHRAARRVEPVGGIRVADRLDGAPGDLLDVDVAPGGDLARDDAKARRQKRLAGDAPAGIDGENRVENGIRDLVRDLVRMPFGDRFGGE